MLFAEFLINFNVLQLALLLIFLNDINSEPSMDTSGSFCVKNDESYCFI